MKLRVNDVEELLLNKAWAEADTVTSRLLRRKFGACSSSRAQVTVTDLLQTWLDDSLLTAMKDFVNASLSQPAFVTNDNLLMFFEVELWLCFYSATPTSFYDSANRDLYPPVWTAMPQSRYMAILHALEAPNQRSCRSDDWSALLSPDRDTAHATNFTSPFVFGNRLRGAYFNCFPG